MRPLPRPLPRLLAAATVAALPAVLLSGLPAGAAVASTRAAAPQAAATVTAAQYKDNDFTGDGKADIVARDRNGNLWIYPGTGRATAPFFGAKRFAGSGWSYNAVVAAGDLTGDGRADVVARDWRGDLWVYPGNGNITSGAGWGHRISAGPGWTKLFKLVAPGDWDGDGHADLLGYTWWGTLALYSGDGHGHFAAGRRIGIGFDMSTTAVGDLTGDGHTDLFFLRNQDSSGWTYPGDGKGGFLPKQDTGSTWGSRSWVFVGPGDFDADGQLDLLARDSSGRLWLYPSDHGALSAGTQIGSGWTAFSDITS